MENLNNKTHITNTSKFQTSVRSGKISMFRVFRNRMKAVNIFYVISSLFQIFLGFMVTAAAIMNLIKPMWLSGFMSLLGCVVAMIGVYQFYDIFKSSRSTQDLARDAIERAIRARN